MHDGRPAPTGEKLASLARKAIELYEPGSSIAALYAACCSPATIGQLPVWSLLLAQALAGHAKGEHPATPQALRRWSRRVRRVVPAVGAYDAEVILDPGLGVHVAWEHALWPLHPGLSLCPEEVLDRVQRYAAAADPVLVPALGFGIADVITLGLQNMAAQHNAISDLWPTPAASRLQPARISPSEVQAMHILLQECASLTEPPGVPDWLREHCSVDQLARLSAAARWCTVDAGQISDGRWLFGGALFVRTDVAVLPVPAGLAIEGIETVAQRLLRLAGRATTHNRTASAADRLASDARSRFAGTARGLPTSLVGPVNGSRGDITGVLSPAGRRLIAVDVAGGTDHTSTRNHVRQAIRRVQALGPGAPLTVDVLDAGDVGRLTARTAPLRTAAYASPALYIRDDVEVVRVVLVAGPYRPPRIMRPGTIVMSLEDWCAITSQSASQPEELWAFLDELAELPGLDRIQANDVMTLWSAFQANGLFYDPFQPEAAYAPGPWHRWAARAAADGHEAVLRNVDLPGLREWPFQSAVHNGLVTVGSVRPYRSVLVSTHPPVVMVVDADTVDDVEWTQTLAESILDGLRRIHDSTDPAGRRGWRSWTTATGDRPIRMQFHPLPAGRADGLALVAISGRTAVFGYTPAATVPLSPEQLHEAIGDALWCLLLAHLAPPQAGAGDSVVSADAAALHHPAAANTATVFLNAWNALSPAARFARVEGTLFPAPQGPPAALSAGGQARARREISLIARSFMTDRHLRGDLDQVRETVLLPAALAAIRQRVAGVDHVDALRVAAVQVERVWAGHGRAERDRTMRLLFGWDPLPASDDANHNQAITTQAADLALETILYDNPDGRTRLDQRDWNQLLTLSAQLLRLAGSRAAAQAGLDGDNAPDPSGRDFTFDAAGHARAVLAAHDRNTVGDLDTRILPTGDSRPADPLPFHAWSQIIADAVPEAPAGPIRHEWQQALAANQAMRDALGTSFDEIFAVLALAPSTATTSETTEITVENLAHRVAAWSGLNPLAVAAAIGQLILTPAILQAEGLNVGRREGRAARLATRPFVPVGEKSVLVMPRRIDAAGQLILAYFSAARLPWPGLPTPVVDAVARWSQARQMAFEIHLENTAKPGRFRLIPRLRPPKALRRGLTIVGEIDLLVIDPFRRRVWVIEAKAGHSGIDPDKILHDLVEFHGPPPGSSHPRWDSYRRKTPFVDRLLEKTAQIQAQLSNLLASERVDHVGEWTVHPLFITPKPAVAAYVDNPRVPFATLENLLELLEHPMPALAGPAHPGTLPATPPGRQSPAATNASPTAIRPPGQHTSLPSNPP